MREEYEWEPLTHFIYYLQYIARCIIFHVNNNRSQYNIEYSLMNSLSMIKLYFDFACYVLSIARAKGRSMVGALFARLDKTRCKHAFHTCMQSACYNYLLKCFGYPNQCMLKSCERNYIFQFKYSKFYTIYYCSK